MSLDRTWTKGMATTTGTSPLLKSTRRVRPPLPALHRTRTHFTGRRRAPRLAHLSPPLSSDIRPLPAYFHPDIFLYKWFFTVPGLASAEHQCPPRRDSGPTRLPVFFRSVGFHLAQLESSASSHGRLASLGSAAPHYMRKSGTRSSGSQKARAIGLLSLPRSLLQNPIIGCFNTAQVGETVNQYS
ncbi:hypothetical protein LX32DRAFT_657603 [Colletotrichum zoysiae]|uniref:Uncharacterized protein n=1 Tax=Colletotrichum zoysiae TaxID=1216348 RepID=A0AAD9H742_9PEZI|nr:hypothetical protein LX32DRAFT_657603 [Colletotrichum zoysiae]